MAFYAWFNLILSTLYNFIQMSLQASNVNNWISSNDRDRGCPARPYTDVKRRNVHDKHHIWGLFVHFQGAYQWLYNQLHTDYIHIIIYLPG